MGQDSGHTLETLEADWGHLAAAALKTSRASLSKSSFIAGLLSWVSRTGYETTVPWFPYL